MLGGGQGGGALFSDGEHGRVDVGYGDVDGGVGVYVVRVVKHAEGDVAGASRYVENALRFRGDGGGEAGVERGHKVISVFTWLAWLGT